MKKLREMVMNNQLKAHTECRQKKLHVEKCHHLKLMQYKPTILIARLCITEKCSHYLHVYCCAMVSHTPVVNDTCLLIFDTCSSMHVMQVAFLKIVLGVIEVKGVISH